MSSSCRRWKTALLALLSVLAVAWPVQGGEEADPLALGPERADPKMGMAFRVPGGIDPGPSSAVGEFGGRHLAFFFGLTETRKVRVKIETYPTYEHLGTFVRKRKIERGKEGMRLDGECPFEGGGFDGGFRLDWRAGEKGDRTVDILLKRFRQVTGVTFAYPAEGEDGLSEAVEAMIGSLRSTVESPGLLPLPAGWRAERTERFEIGTDGEPALVKAVGELLEAGLTEIRRQYPGIRCPEYRQAVRLYGSTEGFAGFRESHGLPETQAAFIFEEARVMVLGPLPKGKQTWRFGRWEIDIRQTLRVLFEQVLLLGVGIRPEPWFTEGAGLVLGLGFGTEKKFDKERVSEEIALGIEEALSSRNAPKLEVLFGKTGGMKEADRLHAAGWVFFFRYGPGQGKKEIARKYLTAFAASWDGKAAREAAFEGISVKKLTRSHARYYLYRAFRAKRRR
ncbi:MAG: hypothetical protein ACYTHM_24545 [Planctomycetota bacterium]|jgi:hypothetical protein